MALGGVGRRYESVYAAIYGFSLERWHGDEYMASFLTACTLAGAVMMNLILAMGVLVIVGWGDVMHSYLPQWTVIPVVGGVLLGNYLAFVRNNRYEKVVARFIQESVSKRRRTVILAWLYVIASYMVPIAVFFIAS